MKLPRTNFKIDYFPLMGGEDLITPALSVKPGRAIVTHNYELDMQGRYRLIDGYEAFDGHPKPSEASYWILAIKLQVGPILIGDTITGTTSAATGDVFLIKSNSLVLNNVTGGFVADEALTISGAATATANGASLHRGADTDILDSTYLLASIEDTRAEIAAVPGSGDILGVWQYNGVKYAFRNNAAGTAAVMYKSSTSGWTACDLGENLPFDTGSSAFVEGEMITATVGTGTVRAYVRRVYVTSGTWAGGDAAGYFTITGAAAAMGPGSATGSIAGVANTTSAQTANTLLPDGTFRFVNENFGGHAGTMRMYACDGVNKAFEWDGTYYVQITTGMTTDTPTHIAAYKKHLFLAFSGGSVQHSGTGTPYVWTAVTGAAELGMGDEVTGFVGMENALAIFSRNSTKLLYGSSIADWDLRPHSDESGAIENTIQKIGAATYMDDRGLTTLGATDLYGDFKGGAISEYVEPFLRPMIGRIQSSVRVKEKNQYRLYFDTGDALTLTMRNNKVIGFTRHVFGKVPICTCSSENSSGREEIFFGASDGFVYQMDAGTSFNGEPLIALIKFHFNHLKSPSQVKRIRKIILELDAPIDTYINVSLEFNYGTEDGQSGTVKPDSPGALWDIDLWDEFVWDGQLSTASVPVDVDGDALNFSMTLYHSGEWELQTSGGFTVGTGIVGLGVVGATTRTGLTGVTKPHTIQGYTVHYDVRRVQR